MRYNYPADDNSAAALHLKSEVLSDDVTGDCTVDAKDLTALSRHVAGVETITDETLLKNADVTGDVNVTAADLTKLARYVAGIDTEL